MVRGLWESGQVPMWECRKYESRHSGSNQLGWAHSCHTSQSHHHPGFSNEITRWAMGQGRGFAANRDRSISSSWAPGTDQLNNSIDKLEELPYWQTCGAAAKFRCVHCQLSEAAHLRSTGMFWSPIPVPGFRPLSVHLILSL